MEFYRDRKHLIHFSFSFKNKGGGGSYASSFYA